MNFDDLLKSLHREYLSSLPKKIETIRAQIAAVDVPAMRESFHKLKGTGRTYGLPEVSELAEAVEEICTDFPDRAATACDLAVEVLRDIHFARVQERPYALEGDARYPQIQKLLQN